MGAFGIHGAFARPVDLYYNAFRGEMSMLTLSSIPFLIETGATGTRFRNGIAIGCPRKSDYTCVHLRIRAFET